MRKFLVLLVAVLGLFCLGTAAMADGFTVYGDYSSLGIDVPICWGIESFTHLTGGAEYDMDPFLVGGFYSLNIGADPEDVGGDTAVFNHLGLYGGYTFINGDTFSLAGIGGYLASNLDYNDGAEEANFTSFTVGLKGTLDMDPLAISALYMFGVANELEVVGFGVFDDLETSYFELKGNYRFTEALSAYLVYRWLCYNSSMLGGEWNLKGYGVGVQYQF